MGEETVRTGAQKERPLQRVERAEHRAGAGEGPEIVARDGARPAVLDQPRRGMAGADENVREALVVAQRDIVAGLELLDQIGLEQERLGLRFGGDEHHRMGLRDHPRDARRLALGRHVGGDALLDRARLADIEHLALLPDHAIDAGSERGVAPEGPDRLGAARHPRWLRRRLVEGDVEGRGIGRKLARQRGFLPRLGRGRFAWGEGVRCAAHGAYLGASACRGNRRARARRALQFSRASPPAGVGGASSRAAILPAPPNGFRPCDPFWFRP